MVEGSSRLDRYRRLEESLMMSREEKDRLLGFKREEEPEQRPPAKVPAGPRSDQIESPDWIRTALQRGY